MTEEATVVVENNNTSSKSKITLEVEVANGIKYTFVTLDEANSGEVAKSQLQAVVANVCRAIKTTYIADDLDSYLSPRENLTVFEFLDFLETKLLVKGKKLNQKEMDELSWVMVGQKYEDEPHLITKKDAFKLWLSFKKLDIAGDLKVDIEELCIFLEKFIRSMGVQWNEQFLREYVEDDGTSLSFWKFIECLENKFLEGIDKNVLKEGLQDFYASILDEVTLTGFLYKKGHSMLKSNKSRWFVLTPDKLTYYVSSGYREKKGEAILNSDAKVSSIPDKGSNKCRFLVTCGQTKKEFEQTAPDQRTRQAWISAIQTAIDCCGGETPLKRDLNARKLKRDEDRRRKAEEERKKQEQEELLSQQREEIDLLKKRKAEIERLADEEKAMLDAEIKRREELEELQRNLQQLLEDQKRAREEEEKVRSAKERLLEEERLKREQLEALRQQQLQELQEEKMQKEELIERQKEQERVLEEERKRLQHLEEERMKAEEAAKAAQDKLTAAESAAKNAAEQAKNRVRQLKTSIGLKGTVGPKVDPLVSHRGKGAFTLEEFLNRATEWSGLELGAEDRYQPAEHAGKPVHTDEELVKASTTATPNKNLPEFLKKAAAWSGLNPETYLEEGKEETKATGPPPKVAAKPQRSSSTSGDNHVQQGAEEDSKGQMLVNGEPSEAEVPAVIAEAKDDVVKDEEPEPVEGTNEVVQENEGGEEVPQDQKGDDEVPQGQEMAREEQPGLEQSESNVSKGEQESQDDEGTVSEKVDVEGSVEPKEPEGADKQPQVGDDSGLQGDSQVDGGEQVPDEVPPVVEEKEEEKGTEGDVEGSTVGESGGESGEGLQKVAPAEEGSEEPTVDQENGGQVECNAVDSPEKESTNADEIKEVETEAKVDEIKVDEISSEEKSVPTDTLPPSDEKKLEEEQVE